MWNKHDISFNVWACKALGQNLHERSRKEWHVFPNKKNCACALAQSSLSLYFSNCLMQLPISLVFIFYNVVSSQSHFQTRDTLLHNDGFWVMILCWVINEFQHFEELVVSICRVTRLVFSAYWSDLKDEVSQLLKKVCKDCGKPETWRGQRE